ncbi:hypothetical protein FRC14_005655 [Serendipita sp. 396]|nr:hypothetical protein FRC14_005655 [Serendipita sp. 396]KAG8819750.1 hypothetical protein FRC19_009563 [Serendipita sp. 401]
MAIFYSRMMDKPPYLRTPKDYGSLIESTNESSVYLRGVNTTTIGNNLSNSGKSYLDEESQ